MISKVQSYFIDYPAASKIWVFMAERPLNLAEQKVVNTYMTQFVPQWQAHGSALKAGFELIENQFVVVIVDETPAAASGCSIDSLTRYIQLIESKLEISLTNRMLITYQSDNDRETISLGDFKQKVREGKIAPQAIVYNNSISNLSDFWDHWQQPISESWASKLLPSP